MEKLARADIIAEERHSIAEELQRMRKDIAQQEAWVKARPLQCIYFAHFMHDMRTRCAKARKATMPAQ